VSSSTAGLLAIDRVAECRNARLAAAGGIGPRVVACQPATGVSVVEWIEGRTCTAADLDSSVQLARVAAGCSALHRGERFAADFDMFDIQQRYLAVVQQFGFRLPSRYLDLGGQVGRIRAALAVRAEPTVPCHNDLLPANIMDDGSRLWFIDYEYAGNNDACFELGNIWAEADLPGERLPELVSAYYGYESTARTARARLLAALARYGWTLWASIQAAVSTVDFDFWSWGLEKYERAVAEFDGAQFDRLIDDVQQPDRPPRGSTQ
jgi:thiamine kinase-like enzyme